MSLLVALRQETDGATCVRVAGEIDLDNAYRLREATDQALAGRLPRQIIIDLRSAPLIDSVGVGVLVSCFHAAAAYRVPLIVADPTPLVHRQLWICGLAGMFGLPTTLPGYGPPIARADAAPAPGDAVGRPVRDDARRATP